MSRESMHLRWPAERFYWAVLDTSALPRGLLGGRSHAHTFDYLFENELPVPVEEVHATYHKLDENTWLACGIDRSTLQTGLTPGQTHGSPPGLPPDAITLTPDTVPAHIQADLDPAELNLLTGRFEPPQIRAMRRRWIGAVLVCVLLCSAALTLGLQRRVSAQGQHLRQIQSAVAGIQREVLGEQADNPRAEAHFLSELRTLRLTRTRKLPDQDSSAKRACSKTLAALLARWPREIYVKTEHIMVTGSSVNVRAEVADSATAQTLADALQSLPGWRLTQPAFRTTRDGVQATLRFVPEVNESADTESAKDRGST